MLKYDVAIIGGGASGLACAAKLNMIAPELSSVIIEAGERLGKKLSATGNGQGNLKNVDMDIAHFHGSGASFAYGLCKKYDHLSLFDCIFTVDKSGRIYPAGKQASSLTDCLIRKIQSANIKVLTTVRVIKIEKGFILTLSDGSVISAKNVVLATGGCAQKQFNTDGKSYELLRGFGHGITQVYPSLVQLKCSTRHIKNLKGIRCECVVSAYSEGKLLAKTSGDVIFTDYGLSGNAIFFISAYCAGVNGVTLSLEFLPGVQIDEVTSDVQRKIDAGYPGSELLAGTLHNQVGRAIVKRAGLTDAAKIASLVKNFTLEVEGSLGFDYAQVTKGGVPFDEVDGDLQSKKVNGLYIVGELLDVDGDCGGYNLSWAFVSGMHAATCIAGACV